MISFSLGQATINKFFFFILVGSPAQAILHCITLARGWRENLWCFQKCRGKFLWVSFFETIELEFAYISPPKIIFKLNIQSFFLFQGFVQTRKLPGLFLNPEFCWWRVCRCEIHCIKITLLLILFFIDVVCSKALKNLKVSFKSLFKPG